MAGLNKLDIAALHVTAAIRMIAHRESPYSVHLLAMAADEIVEIYAEKSGVSLEYAASTRVKPEHQKEWFNAKRHAVNFLKHADRDTFGEYAGPAFSDLQKINDIALTFAIYGLKELKYSTPAHLDYFLFTFFFLYPQFYRWDAMLSAMPQVQAEYNRLSGNFGRADYENYLAHMMEKIA
jgi:hypothetical protein